jgi:signal transduction histidine kinase
MESLANNAVKFTPAGEQIGLKVTDCHDLPQLFQPSIQIDGALNRQFEGNGLELALVKRIFG